MKKIQEKYVKEFKEVLRKFSVSEQVFLETENETLSCKEVFLNSCKLAKEIKKVEDQNIGILEEDNIKFIIAYLAVVLVGKTAVLLRNSKLNKEIQEMINLTGIQVIIGDRRAELENVEWFEIEKLDKNICEENQIKIDIFYNNVSTMVETTGTTAKGKLVELTWKNLMYGGEKYSKEFGSVEIRRCWIMVPMKSVYGLLVLWGAIWGNRTLFFFPDFGFLSQKSFEKVLNNKRIDMIECITSSLIIMSRKYKEVSNTCLKLIAFGGTKISKEEMLKITKTFPDVLLGQGYGLSETTACLTTFPCELLREDPETFFEKIDSVGKVWEGIKVTLDEESGEICVEGDCVAKGYYGEENNVNLKDGKLRTGDIGYFDEQGYLYIRGRIKNIAIIGGRNVQIEEVENLIKEVEGIDDVCIKVEDDIFWGEILVAEVTTTKEIDEYDIKKQLENKIERYKIPKKIKVVPQILYTYNGKKKR